MSFFFNQFFF